MGIKACTTPYQVIIHYPQDPKMDIPGIVILRKGEMKVTVQPAVYASAHVLVIDKFYHINNVLKIERIGKYLSKSSINNATS
jgi:hypothetical protein